MRSHFAHTQINVRQENLPFYRDLVRFLGWETIYDGDVGGGAQALVVVDERGGVLNFGPTNGATNDYDGTGMNHFAIGVNAQADVDAAADYLRERGIAPLFETPRHRPEISGLINDSEDDTYYQVMFASPDCILWEVVYTGPKAA